MKAIKKIFSFLLVCIMTVNVTCFNANANSTNDYSISEKKFGSYVEWYITNNKTRQTEIVRLIFESDGTITTYGWLDPNVQSGRTEANSDFHTLVVDGNIVYSDNFIGSKVVASITPVEIEGGNAYSAELNFPTKWSSETLDKNAALNPGSSIAVVISIVATILGIGTGAAIVLTLAQYIVGNGLSMIYYREVRWSRLLDLLTQEYYSVYTFYKNSNYTGKYGEYTSPKQTVYLG